MPTPSPPDFEEVLHLVATLQTTLEHVAHNQASTKVELSTITPRIDELSAKISVLAAEVRATGERVHRFGNLMVPLIDEAGILHHATITLERAIELASHDVEVRTALERMLDTVETRIGRWRDELADVRAGEKDGGT